MVTSPMPDMTDATPTIEEMPEMQPSAEERAVRVFLGMNAIRPGEEHVPMIRAIERAYRDGYQAALSSLSPLIEAARRVGEAKTEDEMRMARFALANTLSTFPAPASPWRPISEAPKEEGFEADLWCIHPDHGGLRSANMCWDNGQWRDGLGMPLNPGWAATHFMLKPAPPTTSDGTK